jgi:23S rRNA maturation mini-RNase III
MYRIISLQDNSCLEQAVLWREYYIKEKSIMQLTQKKIELIKKIAQARLTPAEVQAITDKADEIINRRKTNKTNS